MAGEFRFNTVTSTFLITPDRRRVIGAKLAAASLVGVAIGARRVAADPRDRPALALEHATSTSRPTAQTSPSSSLGGIAATAISALVGVGIGALVTNQTLAIAVALIWIVRRRGDARRLRARRRPLAARRRRQRAERSATANGGLLPIWAAAALFTAYGLAFAAAGSRFVMRRDVP